MGIVKKFYNEPWFFNAVMNDIQAAVVVTDLNEKIVYVNGATEDLFGYTREEMIGKHPVFTNAEPHSDKIQKNISRVIRSGGVWHEEILNRRKNGELFTLDLKIRSLKDDKGEIVAIIGFQKDITDIQKAKTDVFFSENKYRTMFELAPLAVVMINKKGVVVNCNNKVKDLLGYEREEIIHHPCEKWVHSDFSEECRKQLDEVVKEDKTSLHNEYKFVKKNGQIIDGVANISSIRDENGEFIHTICFLTDITERKHSEMSLKQLAIELKQSNMELEQFAYAASHDLQEPLRVISSYCQLIKEKHYNSMGEESKKYIEYTIEASVRMKKLIKELLDFSRVGREDKPFEDVDVQGIVDEVAVDYKMAISDNKAKIIIEDELPVVYAIRFRMKQLISNLLSNALKFHGTEDTIIRIGCADNGNHWLFYVKDNGIGIEAQYFDRIFGIFKRLYSRDEYPGTGIGLALCKRIVETHGGKIWVDSNNYHGTWMYFTISKYIEVIDAP